MKHYDENNVVVPFAGYASAICVAFQDGVGSSTFDIRKTGSNITKTHIAGLESVTNGITLTGATNSVTFSASNNLHFTLIVSNIT